MTKVFVVTSGEYDDYTIDGVFSTREKAEAMAEKLNQRPWPRNSCTSVEVYDLDPFVSP